MFLPVAGALLPAPGRAAVVAVPDAGAAGAHPQLRHLQVPHALPAVVGQILRLGLAFGQDCQSYTG